MKNLIIAYFLLFTQLANAELKLESPDVLLQKASVDLSGLRDVILDLEFNIQEIRDPITFDKYFYIVDDLLQVGIQHQIDLMYPNAVQNLGLHMVAHGMRWIDATKDNPEKMLYYVQWMESDTLARFLALIEFQIHGVKDPARLTMLAKNIEAIIPVTDKKGETLPYVVLGFRRLVSDAAVAMLKTQEMSLEESNRWISKIRLSSSLAEYMDFLNQKIFSVNSSNKGLSHSYLYFLTLLNKQVNNMSETAPNWLVSSIGDSTTEIIIRMIRFEEKLTLNELSPALEYLKPRQIQNLMMLWMAIEKMPTQSYMANYMEIAKYIHQFALNLEMSKEADDFQKWLARNAASLIVNLEKIEGLYQLKNNKNEVWLFSIANAKENLIVAALTDEAKGITKPFYNVTYDLLNDRFLASSREPDSDYSSNPTIEFRINKDGEITLKDLVARSASSVFTGHRTQEYFDIWSMQERYAPIEDGVFEGLITMPSGQKVNAMLSITRFNNYSLGKLEMDDLTIDLTVGSKGQDGVIILTSGRYVDRSWIQIRGYLENNELKFAMIFGTKGQAPGLMTFKRK